MTPAQFDAALDELLLILRARGLPDLEDTLRLRLAELQIAREAMAVTSQRNRQAGGAITAVVAAGLTTQIAWLAQDILGYYATPLEHPGSNEPPIGTSTDRRLRQLFQAALDQDEQQVMQMKDDLADFLSRMGD
ncbi:MAG: hypothetical protein ACFHX7_01675 [Pseudomonadota bacterium]